MFGFEYWDSNKKIWSSYSISSGFYTPSYINSFSASTGLLQLKTTDFATYDMLPWYNVTAKLTVTSTNSVQTANYLEDTFDVTIVESCR